jgi:hypothetical protein
MNKVRPTIGNNKGGNMVKGWLYKKGRYQIIQGLWYFEIIDTNYNELVGSQETLPKAKKVVEKLLKEGR